METKESLAGNVAADFFIDITADICPITFVRAKLLIERMASGQTAEIRLRGAVPLRGRTGRTGQRRGARALPPLGLR